MPQLGKMLELVYKLRGEDVPAAMYELKNLENSDPETVATYKERKLRGLLDFVGRECSFYRDIVSQKIPASGNGSAFEALQELPAVDKWTIKNNLGGFMTHGEKTSWRSTSGTTGTPFVFPKDRHASAYMDAMMYCAYAWHGIGPLTRQARIWGSAIGRKGKVAQKVKDRFLGRKRLSAFEITDANCRRYFFQLLKHKPKYFYCYPNAMYQFVLSLERQGLDGREIGATLVICTGEVLFSQQREKIEQITGCRVINEYGSTENGIIAFECEYGTMHVMPTIHVDVLSPDNQGYGTLAITELNSRSVPFIKYENGDIGRNLSQECECQSPFESIEMQNGRSNDVIICPDDSVVYSAILAYIMKNHVLQFKAYQEAKNIINIYIIPNINYTLKMKHVIIDKLKQNINDDIQFNIIEVNEINFDDSGKLRYFKSKIV
jgi:phenylacetate-CoA ligase